MAALLNHPEAPSSRGGSRGGVIFQNVLLTSRPGSKLRWRPVEIESRAFAYMVGSGSLGGCCSIFVWLSRSCRVSHSVSGEVSRSA